jgi:hypothetical protein
MEPVPQVISSNTPLPSSSGWKKKIPVISVVILSLVILFELFWGYRVLRSPSSVITDTISSEIIDSVKPQIIAQTPKKNFKINEIVPVEVKIVTAGNPADSADLIIRFDPRLLEASGSSFFELGRIYPEYPVADIDRKAGLIQLSATTPSGLPGFTGIGTLVKLNFKAKAIGETTISVDFQENSTAESNIVLSNTNKDILAYVRNAPIAIGNTADSETKSEPQSCSGFFQYCQINGKTGKQFCQNGVKKNNTCTFDPDLTVSCSECQVQ